MLPARYRWWKGLMKNAGAMRQIAQVIAVILIALAGFMVGRAFARGEGVHIPSLALAAVALAALVAIRSRRE